MPKLPPTVPDRAQAANRMILRPRRTKSGNSVDTAPKVFQDTVFSIPELVHLITDHLIKRDLAVLIRVNRAWNSIWIPYLYKSLSFSHSDRTDVYPTICKYGDHVMTLCLTFTTWASTQHFLYFTNNLQSLTLRFQILCTSYLEQITETVPQLRALHITLEQPVVQPLDCQMTPVATLKNLKDFSWCVNTNVRIDDILLVLRNCRQLRSLILERVAIVEELKNAHHEQEPDEKKERTGLSKVDDEGWVNTSLRSLNLTVRWHPEDSSTTHPHFRRLFQHLPNLECIKLDWKSNVIALDWRDIFEDRATLQRTMPESHITTIDLDHCTGSSVRNDTSVMGVVMAVVHEDQALTQPTRMPRSVHVSPGISQSLVAFDIEGCLGFNSINASILLENCTALRRLNLLGTMAGTIELFKGSKPWPCANMLENLSMDIQPLDYQPPPFMEPWPPLRLYTSGEMQSIWGRLCSFTSLVGLKLGGEALTFDMIQDFTFAPNLRVVNLEFPMTADNMATLREVALVYGQALFPNWIVSSDITYLSFRPAVAVTAHFDKTSYMFEWPR
ncbi:hypothetical protein BC939DRAFT_455227 [Gamsiella multidivaricata]|uniref:uncharacterized protein n=1 Tax=Gamsiella multidivaricata TaxID=101098 RepID=UPI00221E3ACA|nr:uncharacterized protein BC939DRAFT_455227 [Gamsiella multidivaricata]KAG0352192.1 hypothetical protein BGZ54_002904 [Gamsiella multidivaricata]KAI7821727.1 hypothetical protein BC939DRAFT_455227 [Gamsiella multidivaricata]